MSDYDHIVKEPFVYERLAAQSTFPLICVYEKPLDYPDLFVARVWDLQRPTRLVAVAETLDGIRAYIPAGMTRLPRTECDDPRIVEVWI